MANSKTKNREKIWAIITIIIVLVALVYTVILEPQIQKKEKSLQQMNQMRLKLAKMKTDVLMKDRTDKIYSIYEPIIASIGSDQQDISVFTRELRDMYKDLRVNIRTVIINPIAREEFFKQLSVKIEMSGNIRDILSFICKIDTYDRPIHIELLDIISQEITDNVKASFIITK
jgi:Tfp pilus assembly protein PilO